MERGIKIAILGGSKGNASRFVVGICCGQVVKEAALPSLTCGALDCGQCQVPGLV